MSFKLLFWIIFSQQMCSLIHRGKLMGFSRILRRWCEYEARRVGHYTLCACTYSRWLVYHFPFHSFYFWCFRRTRDVPLLPPFICGSADELLLYQTFRNVCMPEIINWMIRCFTILKRGTPSCRIADCIHVLCKNKK